MNQRTHAWLAIRAVALLEELNKTPQLVKLLKPHLQTTAIGTWIPDLRDTKKGSGDIDNHVLKMKPYKGSQKKRFTVTKPELLELLGKGRRMYDFLEKNKSLKPTWWDKPYKAYPRPGQHLANRAMALTTTLIDLLILGDARVADHLPKKTSFISKIDPEAKSTEEQIATYFFMQSHFVADACMPCHCDARTLSGYSKGLHHELEGPLV